MVYKEISIEEYLANPGVPLIDVRSPAEYTHAHIPGAVNMPLFSDTERKQTGITYKQEGQEAAIQLGLDLVGVKLSRFVAEVINIAVNNSVAVHCWRGGMRSKSMAILFDFAGIQTFVIKGGYKSYRRLAKKYFDMPFSFLIVGGKTGSGKTDVLRALQKAGEQVIDLEALAHHKGSAFGDLGEPPQPTTEQFENDLCIQLLKCALQERIWLEDESHLIGTVFIPERIWQKMRNAPVLYLDVPLQERIDYLVRNYGQHTPEKMENALKKITKRLGGQHYKEALEMYRNGNLAEATEKVLIYYDKAYAHGLSQRNIAQVYTLPFETISPEFIANELTRFANQKIRKEMQSYY